MKIKLLHHKKTVKQNCYFVLVVKVLGASNYLTSQTKNRNLNRQIKLRNDSSDNKVTLSLSFYNSFLIIFYCVSNYNSMRAF